MEEQLAGKRPKSQFGQALGELGVELIAAHSPQAKGRVERLFQTLQDRLIKEMRLARMTTMEAANDFLAQYLPRYNRRFAVVPAQPADLHRPRPTAQVLVRSLCIKTTRCLRKDFTIAHDGRLYQVQDNLSATRVVGRKPEWNDATDHQGRSLSFHLITARPVSTATVTTVSRPRPPISPAADHPWRKRWRSNREPHPAAARP